MRVNKCLPSRLTNVYSQWVNKQGGYVNTPCLPRVFILMFMSGQSVRLLQNNANCNASQLQGVKELRVKAEIIQTADRGKIQKIGGENMKLEEVNAKILEGLSSKERADFEAGLKALNMANPADRAALRESIKRLRPEFTPEQIEIFVTGEAPPDKQEWLQ